MAIELCAGNHDIADDGLVNGAEGKYMSSNLQASPPLVWIEFTHTTIGQKARHKSKHLYSHAIPRTWTPLYMLAKEFQIGKNPLNTITRK